MLAREKIIVENVDAKTDQAQKDEAAENVNSSACIMINLYFW